MWRFVAGRLPPSASGIPAAQARKVVSVRGLYVTPGLVDIHTHVFTGDNGWTPSGGNFSIFRTRSHSGPASPRSPMPARLAAAISLNSSVS